MDGVFKFGWERRIVSEGMNLLALFRHPQVLRIAPS